MTQMPALPNTTDKDAIVKFLSDSFAYCAAEIYLRVNGIKPPNYMV
jgi:hypothetical protein